MGRRSADDRVLTHGLSGPLLVRIDGKLAAAASAEHTVTDAAEDELFGPEGRGDEVPAELCDPRSRDETVAKVEEWAIRCRSAEPGTP